MESSKPWKFIGGSLSLDFVNSVGGRRQTGPNESAVLDDWLGSYSDLVRWSSAVGLGVDKSERKLLHPASKSAGEAMHVLGRALLLRESLFQIFHGVYHGETPSSEDLEVLNRECLLARSRQKIHYGKARFSWTFEQDEEALDRLLGPIALSAAELLVSEDLRRIRECPGRDCGWLFLDTSKNGSRQWCDMRTCGTLNKVRRFREKRRAAKD